MCISYPQGCVFTRDMNRAIQISDAMATGTVQVWGHALLQLLLN
jgi:hypothetical protein